MGPIAETAFGMVEGLEDDGVSSFRGIPFARPPAGALRFAAPKSPEPWTGVRAARRFGPAAPQALGPMSTLPGFAVEETSEDCLSLNVWTPSPGGAGLPVMVWIPGGGFSMGSGSQEIYDGASLARRGHVVVVTINYRLGAMGFLSPRVLRGSTIEISANAGLLDQVAALRWVHDNISGFGGDPDQVTVFGESAGAMSVASLLAMPSAHGLFHRAIAQSGAENTASAEEAADLAASFLAALGIEPSDSARLADVPIDAVLAAQQECSTEYMRRRKGLAWRPFVDGDVIPGGPGDVMEPGAPAHVPLLLGTNADEWKLFGLGDPRAFHLDDARLAARLTQVIGSNFEDVLAAYKSARPEATPGQLWFAIETDRNFRIPAIRLADCHSRAGAQTYCYLFTWESPVTGLGSCHGLEIPFVFGNLDKPGMPVFAGNSPEAARLSDVMQDAWLAFARTGDPSTPALGQWPVYDSDRRATMMLGGRCEVADAPHDEERRAWESVASGSASKAGTGH